MLTADQPWSGWYGQMPALWATAHFTQFTEIGWTMLPVGSGSGALALGGFYVTFVDPWRIDYSVVITKISREHGDEGGAGGGGGGTDGY
jgi:galactosylceramidase